MSAQTYTDIVGVLIVLYLFGILNIAYSLKKKHPETWDSLGRPTLFNWSIANSFRLAWYVFFKGDYRLLNDNVLSVKIMIERVLAIATFVAIIGWNSTVVRAMTGH